MVHVVSTPKSVLISGPVIIQPKAVIQDSKLSQTIPAFYVCAVQVFFGNSVGKGEIARNEQFLLFPQCFNPVLRIFCHFYQI